MAALTAGQRNALRDKNQLTIAIKNASVIFLGGYVALELATGRVVPFSDVAGLVELGRAVEFDSPLQTNLQATGNSAGTVKVVVDLEGGIIEDVPVSGAAAETDVGDQVSLPSDNIGADLQTGATANTKAIGEIVRFHTSTSFDVLLYTQETIRGL